MALIRLSMHTLVQYLRYLSPSLLYLSYSLSTKSYIPWPSSIMVSKYLAAHDTFLRTKKHPANRGASTPPPTLISVKDKSTRAWLKRSTHPITGSDKKSNSPTFPLTHPHLPLPARNVRIYKQDFQIGCDERFVQIAGLALLVRSLVGFFVIRSPRAAGRRLFASLRFLLAAAGGSADIAIANLLCCDQARMPVQCIGMCDGVLDGGNGGVLFEIRGCLVECVT
ncbi:hypothetical protein IWX50DRAFT_39967 [Phyllosticta citricarpa]|uniref:Uncharacterized protein n=1 Tax=Phyllosticta citricarpa TaxID=55181 RepID=A0ABR1LZL0_9PEZI